MKKAISLILIVAMIMVMGGTANAALTCNATMQTSKTEYSKGDEFTIDINTTNMKSENGIIAFSGTLEYDKTSLTLKDYEGKNGWSTPSYNEENGKLVMDRNKPATGDETIMSLTFKVNENSKSNLTIILKDISIANGYDSAVKIGSISKSITIVSKVNIPVTNPTTNPTTTPSTKPVTTPSATTIKPGADTTSTVKPTPTPAGKLPQTGLNDMSVVAIVIGVFAIIAVVSCIRMKQIGKTK